MNSNLIARFYNSLGDNYYKGWKGMKNGMELIRKFELSFIKDNLKILENNKSPTLNVLDIGSGPGRIAEIILEDKRTRYYGIDISSEMIKSLKKRFAKKRNFIDARVGNALTDISYQANNFDLVTCIRVLKYNKNWPKIIKNIYRLLKKDGLFLFSIPNNRSLNFFSRGKLPIYKTNVGQITQILKKIGFKSIKIEKSSKLPDLIYLKTSNQNLLRLYSNIERVLNIILREKFSRLLYISCIKR